MVSGLLLVGCGSSSKDNLEPSGRAVKDRSDVAVKADPAKPVRDDSIASDGFACHRLAIHAADDELRRFLRGDTLGGTHELDGLLLKKEYARMKALCEQLLTPEERACMLSMPPDSDEFSKCASLYTEPFAP